MSDDEFLRWFIERAENEPTADPEDHHRRNRDLAMGCLYCRAGSDPPHPGPAKLLSCLRQAISGGEVVLAAHIVLASAMLSERRGELVAIGDLQPKDIEELLDALMKWVAERATRGDLLLSLRDRAPIAALSLAGRLDDSVREAARREAESCPERLDRWLRLCFGSGEEGRGGHPFSALFPPGEATTEMLQKRRDALRERDADSLDGEDRRQKWIEEALKQSSAVPSTTGGTVPDSPRSAAADAEPPLNPADRPRTP